MNNPSGARKPEVDYFQPYKEPDAVQQQRRPVPPRRERAVQRPEPPEQQAERPRRKRRLLPWLLVVGAGAVIAIVAVVVAVLSGGETPGETPSSTAQAFVDAINGRDVAAVNNLTCNAQDKVDQAQFAATAAGFSQVRVKSVGEPNDGQSILVVTAVVGNQETQERFPLRQRENQSWCVGKQGDATG